MSDTKNVDNPSKRDKSEVSDTNIAVSSNEVSSVAGSVQTAKTQSRVSSSSDRQIKFERAQKCLENAALVSKRIKEHRKATAELLGRPFEEDDGGDTASEMASTMSEKTGYSIATDTSTAISVQDALNIPGISESLANTLKQKELLMERIKQYKEISKRPIKTAVVPKKITTTETKLEKSKDSSDVTQLINTLKERENALNVFQVRMKAMETTILELQEKINEKDQIIEAKNKATTLMSDNLSKKEKDSLALLEDSRQQMIKMQENFINMETEWKYEKNRLIKIIEEKDEKIASLEEANTILENSRFEISVANSKLVAELELKNEEIYKLKDELEKISQAEIKPVQELTQKEKEDVEEEKGSMEISNMIELTKKIEMLEQLNCQIRQTNKELENKLANFTPEPKSLPSGSPSKKSSPLPTRKGGRSTMKKSPWSQLSSESLPQEVDKKPNKNEISKLEMVVQSLNKDILDKEYQISEKDSLIIELKSMNEKHENIIKELQSNIRVQADVVHVGICTDTKFAEPEASKYIEPVETAIGEGHLSTDVKELEDKLKEAENQISLLNSEIDAANKNMIKVKASHKLKLKQMQKTIDNFSKVSDANAEIVKLNEELHQLSQKVAELEEEKGNLQLHLVDYDSGRLTESDVYKKMVEMENLAEARLKAISVLETQKFDLVQELHDLQQKTDEMEDKLADMSHFQSEQVSSEMKSVQLEEQIDHLSASKKELELVIENLKLDKEQLEGTIKGLEEEKEELLHKLENYIQENMELTDKLEKLSAEKVSSAESIEIVESLTTQEKLELEEYNKGNLEHKSGDSPSEIPVSPECKENIEKLVEQSAELNKKIELFTQERQEVMEKMNKICSENEALHQKMSEMNHQCNNLQSNIELLSHEKLELIALNNELNRQIEELKRERLEIMRESMEMVKPTNIEETAEGTTTEAQHDDKSTGEKGNNRAKTVKQLTKDILKLKNTIKDREAEIGDCQMKILSLEEQQQKHNELIQINLAHETKLKHLTEENHQLRKELENKTEVKFIEQHLAQAMQTQELLQQEIQNLHHDYSSKVNSRDARIQELENLLLEYEKQIFNYGNSLQQKDKEMSEYINQITKLNDVSQKLKSTIELLEEEKAKDPNAELVKNLNKQISANQKKLAECEDKIRNAEEEQAQLLSLKIALENRNVSLETELKTLQETFAEKQNLIKDLQTQQQKHAEEMSDVMLQIKERDEEVHEMKLQLRKESIENEKLRKALSEKESSSSEFRKELEDANARLQKLSKEKEELHSQHAAMETKNKELMEKLKKFAASVKKKSSMYAELENHMNEIQKQLESKSLQLEQLFIQVETLPALQEKLKYAEEELNRLQSQKVNLEQQKMHDISLLQTEIKTLQDNLTAALNETAKLNDELNAAQKELYLCHDENSNLKLFIDTLNNKIADYEVEQKNNTNFITKISSLEADINQKQIQITELLSKFENQEKHLSQLQFGQDAKIQERDLYIESLETEINKYKNRICRLEESISVMEDRRHTLERKADQLDTQLQEKQKAYSDYTSQEDQLVSRLAVLMDHDRVVEKQLHEIENENKELQIRTHQLSEENQRLRKTLSDIQDHCNTLEEKASRTDFAESELVKYQTQLHELDINFKRVTHEHQALLIERKRQIEEIEGEFNTQIENAIKEKKMLSEKYEKINEHVSQLENKLHEYRSNNETLKINIEELSKINANLMENSIREPNQVPDYTEQYINEINKLNSVVNNRDQQIHELNDKMQAIETNKIGLVSNLERKIHELNERLQNSSTVIDQLMQQCNAIKASNDHLQTLLYQKDEQIKRLTEEKSVTFEMTIPKTEGMIISSTIEPLREGPKQLDVSSIESQIVSQTAPISPKHTEVKTSEQHQKSSAKESGEIIEPEIVAKKAYLCYKGDENVPQQSDDPFNSDEGWGLGESEEIGEVTPGLTNLNNQIRQLKMQNEALKADLDASNNKLLRALKKLKELKTNNDMLANELKISKQLSQSSMLDSAIEDEMKINIQELEKKIEKLTADLSKEKRENDFIKKQNEVFVNANDRLTEIKEKLENEIALWKHKFKEVNDKMSTLQWGADPKKSPEHKATPVVVADEKSDALKEEIIKLEKENDELQSMVDQLTSQNKDLLSKQDKLKAEINDCNVVLQQNQSLNENYATVNNKLAELQKGNTELLSVKDALVEKIRDLEIRLSEMSDKCEQKITENEEIQNKFESLQRESLVNIRELENEINSLKISEAGANDKILALVSELETAKLKLVLHDQEHAKKPQSTDTFALSEKYSSLENYSAQLKHDLEAALSKLIHLEAENHNLEQKSKDYEHKISELEAKIQHLNTENDQLLSSVTELRSNIASAVDQRGFEIAELWKQHLAQREADFQKTEQELRIQLNASEARYDQLLDNVQSSTQEETNKLVIMEQVTSLQNKLQDKEEHLRNLQDKYAEIMNQLDMMRSELEDEKVMYENKLLGQQEEYEKQIKDFTVENQQQSESLKEAYSNLQKELAATKAINDELNEQVRNYLKKVEESEAKIIELANQLKLKDSEIFQKTNDLTITLTQRNDEFETVRKQLLDYEKKIEDLSYEKESELAILRLKMHEKKEDFVKSQQDIEEEKLTLTQELNAKIIECTKLNKQITDLNKKMEEHLSNTAEMQTALENQEIEIVTLKDEISNLQDILRSSSSKIEKHVTFASDTKPGQDVPEQAEEALNRELLESVPRAELDLALYMLHQRDVRCEELTMELTQLLEERDTLQLRLSDSLRSNEELKSQCKSAGLDISISSQETISDLPTFNVEREQHFVDVHRGQSSRSSSISDPDGDKPKLQAKLSELRSVRHSRDVRLRHESEQRQMDLRLLQRDVANLPPEAVDQLAQAHHTLSRDSQSTSTVLLNWLRGKSTPKVVHM